MVSSVKREFPTKALVRLCYAAGAPPPNNRFMKKHLSEFIDCSPIPVLLELCRQKIRSHLLKVTPPGNLFTFVPMLGLLPQTLVSYLLYDASIEAPQDELDNTALAEWWIAYGGDKWWKAFCDDDWWKTFVK